MSVSICVCVCVCEDIPEKTNVVRSTAKIRDTQNSSLLAIIYMDLMHWSTLEAPNSWATDDVFVCVLGMLSPLRPCSNKNRKIQKIMQKYKLEAGD